MGAASDVADGVIRVAVIDDDDLVRTGLAAILDVEPDIEVVGQAGDGADVPALIATSKPHVVLMDVRMPRIDGIAATERLSRMPDSPAVVVITTFENDTYVHQALLAGARAFVLKRATPEELVDTIRIVVHTEALVFPEAVRRVAVAHNANAAPPAWAAQLTERERDVLHAVAKGLTNAEIGAELFVTVETVKTHVRSLLAKSGSRHRTELVVRAYDAGLLASR